jgi:hypothetical protein
MSSAAVIEASANKRTREEEDAAAPVMSSDTAKTPAAKGKADAAAAKVTPADKPASKDNSPYALRMKEIRDAHAKLGKDTHSFMKMPCTDELIRKELAPLMGDDYDDDEDDMDDDTYQDLLHQLTQEQVDACLHFMIVPNDCIDLLNEYADAIRYSDTRYNQPGDGMLMFNTYSSYLMANVIEEKLLKQATKAVNKAVREVKKASDSSNTKNIGKDAFKQVFAAVMAANSTDHWLHDTEEPERCDEIAKKLFPTLVKDLLWLEDDELGISDAYTRKAFIAECNAIRKEWGDIEWIQLPGACCTPRNGNGLGRSHAAAKAPPTKKPKTTATVFTTDGGSADSGAVKKNDAAAFVSDMPEAKIAERVKTQLQLTIVDKDGKQATVVLSGTFILPYCIIMMTFERVL